MFTHLPQNFALTSKSQISNVEKELAQHSNISENVLISLGTVLAVVGSVIGAAFLVFGFFGMNIVNNVETELKWFQGSIWITIVGSLILVACTVWSLHWFGYLLS